MKPKSASPRSAVYINLNDIQYTEAWVRNVTESVHPWTELLEVHFVGGGPLVDPSSLLSLHNALTRLPESVVVRTVATCSLSPFACVAWLAGDERWIAQNAKLWIPRVPQHVLRGVQRAPDAYPTPPPPPDWRQQKTRETSSEMDPYECEREFFHEPCSCDRCRIETELCTVSEIVNAWFPSWEYAGRALTCGELLDLGVIRPEWIFGGASSRGTKPRFSRPKPGASENPHLTPCPSESNPTPHHE
jgi:hypothetical protein